MLIPKETHSAREETIALQWEICQNLHVEFSFFEADGVTLFMHLSGKKQCSKVRSSGQESGVWTAFQLGQFPLTVPVLAPLTLMFPVSLSSLG